MITELTSYYKAILTPEISSAADYPRFLRRIEAANLTRIEEPLSHVCAMTVAFDGELQKVLVVHHRKANSWMFPGGHIEEGELPVTTAMREAAEEFGATDNLKLLGPFAAQILDIDNPPQVCREHYDLFYAVEIAPEDVVIDEREFLGYEWLTPQQAYERIELEYYRRALDSFIRFMGR